MRGQSCPNAFRFQTVTKERRSKMRSWLFTGILAAAIALPALSGAAWAGGTDDYGCSNATLKGEYAFGVTAYTPAGLPNGPPQVVAGIKVFDGNGNLTQRDYIGDSLRTTGQIDFSTGETGTYTVNANCTGSHGDQRPSPGTFHRGHKHHVCDQRRRPSYPRSRFGINSAGIYYRTRVHPNQCRRLEGRVRGGALGIRCGVAA